MKVKLKFFLLLFLMGGSGSTVQAQRVALPLKTIAMNNGQAVADQVLVRLRPERDHAAGRAGLALFGTLSPRGESDAVYQLNLRPGLSIPQALAALRAQPEVLYAEPNYLRYITADPDDPNYSQQYALRKIKANLAWSLWQPRRQAVVAVVDTGVQTDHPDLANMIFRDYTGAMIGFNAVTNTVMTGPNDGHGHGTRCSGIAAAQTNNGLGVAGYAWNGVAGFSDTYDIKIMPVKVLGDNGRGTDGDLAQGMNWAVDHGAEVISMSLGDLPYSQVLDDACQYAWNRGVLVVAAAGNHGNTALFYPAANANVVSVAATDSNDMFASWSAYGNWVSVAAPGVSINTTNRPNGYVNDSGTSMACPLVAGLATFLLAHNPTLTRAYNPTQNNAARLSEIIRTTCDALPAQAKFVIHGRINAQAALQATESPPLSGVVTLDDWDKRDTTPNQTGNVVRVFIFPAGSNPTSEANALAWRDVPLDERGWFSLPAGVVADGTYRIGMKPITAYGLAKLVPGNVTLSETAPSSVALTLPLGDALRNGSVDVLDLDVLIQAFDSTLQNVNWDQRADFNGDESVDVLDLDILIRNFDMASDFVP
jgi:thermitase